MTGDYTGTKGGSSDRGVWGDYCSDPAKELYTEMSYSILIEKSHRLYPHLGLRYVLNADD